MVFALALLALAPVGLKGGGRSASDIPAVPHEVPADVAVQAYIRPMGSLLTVLVRVPLESMRDVEFPLRESGALELTDPELRALLEEAATIWIAGYLRFYEDGQQLGDERIVATQLSIPSDRSFASFEGAAERIAAPPLASTVELRPTQAFLDVRMEVPIRDPGARFAVDPELAHLGIETVSVIHLVLPNGVERVFQYVGNPGRVELDPRWHQAVFRFVAMGFGHILGGVDHLLFVLCLVIPLRSFRSLVPVVTAFTVAHSITLIAAALGLAPSVLWFVPLIETLIAASIVWMALENIVGAGLSRRWMVAFGFGLVHGFGFSFVLADSLQFAGAHLITSLLAFNVGVELGQLAVLLVAVPVLAWLFRRVVAERMGVVVLSVIVAHTAWHWMTARGATLLLYDLRWPALDSTSGAVLLGWGLLVAVCLGAGWGLSGVFGSARAERVGSA
jgi:hypothetical protein